MPGISFKSLTPSKDTSIGIKYVAPAVDFKSPEAELFPDSYFALPDLHAANVTDNTPIVQSNSFLPNVSDKTLLIVAGIGFMFFAFSNKRY